jgi:elongation factor Ts
MAITAGQVKELREKTGVGMMECKKALQENDGDLEKSIVWLRERGMSRAAKKAGRTAAEGIVDVYISDDNTAGVLVEVNCETDFVAKNSDFQEFARGVSKIALEKKTGSIDELEAATLGDKTVKETLTELIAKIGENMNLRRVKVVSVSNGVVAGYSHMGGKIGSLVVLEGATGNDVSALGKDIAMHVAAASPKALVEKDVDASELEVEKEIARKKLIEEGKPEAMIEKILMGQMAKFYKEICLTKQAFVKDPSISVEKHVEASGTKASLTAFARFQLGEGIEKKKENFAEEVAAQIKG